MIYCEDVHCYKDDREKLSDSFNKIITAFFIIAPEGFFIRNDNKLWHNVKYCCYYEFK